MSIGTKIKSLRKKMGFTQKDLADGIVSRSMLSLIESDTAVPSMQSLCAIAKKLSVSPSFLLEDGNDISNIELERIASVIKKEYQEKNYKNVLGIIEHSNLENDSRFSDIFTKCAFESAYTDFAAGNFRNAVTLLEKVNSAASSAILVNTENLLKRTKFLYMIIENISTFSNKTKWCVFGKFNISPK